MAGTTTSLPAKLSFADIVKGSTTPSPPAALRPAARGEKRCYCQGEVLVMLSHYGWIMTFDEIDHPDVGMTGGRVYVHKRDVVEGDSLAQGDTVSFYLYADEQGLGAECCQLEQSVPPSLSADAAEFVPVSHEATTFEGHVNHFAPKYPGSTASWNICAGEFVPSASTPFSSGLNVDAGEFIPASGLSLEAAEFVPSQRAQTFMPANKCVSIATINPAFLSDDESDDERSIVGIDDFSGNEADKESTDSDKDSSCAESLESFQQDQDFESGSDLDVVVLRVPLKSPQASSMGDSTSVGALSDSEDERIVHCAVRAPPGLSLPVGWRPPPGLSLPVVVA